MKVLVDSGKCVACGLCELICPDVFEMDGEHAWVKCYPVPADQEDACNKAAQRCLVDAILVSD